MVGYCKEWSGWPLSYVYHLQPNVPTACLCGFIIYKWKKEYNPEQLTDHVKLCQLSNSGTVSNPRSWKIRVLNSRINNPLALQLAMSGNKDSFGDKME